MTSPPARRIHLNSPEALEFIEAVEEAFSGMSDEQRAALSGLLDLIDNRTPYTARGQSKGKLFRDATEDPVTGTRISGREDWRIKHGVSRGILKGYRAGSEDVTSFIRVLISPEKPSSKK